MCQYVREFGQMYGRRTKSSAHTSHKFALTTVDRDSLRHRAAETTTRILHLLWIQYKHVASGQVGSSIWYHIYSHHCHPN